MFSEGQSLRLNRQAAEKLDHEMILRQLKEHKLSLILDLDHTLLHATQSPEAEHLLEFDGKCRSPSIPVHCCSCVADTFATEKDPSYTPYTYWVS